MRCSSSIFRFFPDSRVNGDIRLKKNTVQSELGAPRSTSAKFEVLGLIDFYYGNYEFPPFWSKDLKSKKKLLALQNRPVSLRKVH